MSESLTVVPQASPAPNPAPAEPTAVERLIARLEAMAEQVATLRVTSTIGPISDGKITESSGVLTVSFQSTPKEVACTTIDTVLGNITTTRTQEFADNLAYAKLHDDSLLMARAVRSETIQTITKLLEALKAAGKF